MTERVDSGVCLKCGKRYDYTELIDICGVCEKPIVFDWDDTPMPCCENRMIYCDEECCPHCNRPIAIITERTA